MHSRLFVINLFIYYQTIVMKKNQPFLTTANLLKTSISASLFIRRTVFLLLFACITQISFGQSNPDIPDFAKFKLNKEEFMARRSEAIGFRRGIEKNKPFDPSKRILAIRQMEEQKMRLASRANNNHRNILSAWTEIGPNPIPNGQVVSGPQLAVSGRTISIAVHPTDPDIVYVGTAQGGLYRSLNGGNTWVPILDNALSLAVNTVAIAASQPNTIFVGTGEANFSADSYFGAGIYRIDNANSATPTITGPIGGSVFTGRAVSKIVVHPTDPNIIFAGSASGIGGIGAASNNSLANRGLFRSTNALSASPTFTQLTLTGLAAQTRNIVDMVMDPGNPDRVLCTVGDSFSAGEGGVYLSTNALAAIPTFVRTFTAGIGTNASRTELALHRSGGGVVTVYAASGFNGGTVQRSIDGGATWTQQIDNNFCGGQCFYDIAIEVDPTNADRVYLGGTGTTTTFTISTNGGSAFTSSASGLHTDSHVITVAPSLATTIYFGSDGGIYKSTNAGATWASLNNSTFRATQFMSLAVHPIDPNFTIGGTQDNGTNFYQPNGTWTRADFGDGGYSLIDQGATDNINVDMYHTYFNNTSLKGYATVSLTASATEGNWVFRGCNGSAGNGIACGGAVLFYAPIEQGPGTPNTVYYGANILYRSADKGLNHTAVSQNLTDPISAIGISTLNDNVRIVGQSTGGLFGTTTGSATLTNLDAGNVVPNNFIARTVIDPNNVNTAYVTLSAFGVVNVWKTINLNNAAPTWTAAATGIPNVPVNAFVVDPTNSNNLFAGTDIGVYTSADAGVSWIPLGTGLPIVAVFDMAIQPVTQMLRIATHGRGMWQIPIGGVVCNVSGSGTTTPVTCFGNTNGTATVTLTGDGSGATGTYTVDGGAPQAYATNPFTVTNLAAGNHTIVATVTAGGCVSTDIIVNVGTPATFTASIVKTNLSSCSGGLQDGSITVTPAGGVPPYTYAWTGITGSGNPATTVFPNPGNVSSITGLNYGFYNVTITDAGGCGSVTISNIHVQFAYAVFVTNNGSSSSACGNTGSVTLYGNAGVIPYTFALVPGTGMPTPAPGSFQASGTFNLLAAGPYSGFIKDAGGCVSAKNITVGSIAAVAANPFAIASSSCNADGSIQIFKTGGVGPYTYSLNAGAYQASNFFPGLAAGPYTANVKDGNGCIGSAPVTVGQGAALSVTAFKTNTSSCVNNGSIQVNVTGGVAPYTYSINGGLYQASNSFTGLGASTYAISVKDAKNCTGSLNVTINVNTIIVTAAATAASSCIIANGKIQLFRTGGTGPYTYSLNGSTYQASTIFLGLAAGTYDGYVKDAFGCIGVLNGIVVGPTGCAPPPPPIAGTFTKTKTSKISETDLLKVEVYPNPTATAFTLVLTGNNKDKVTIIVRDITGRKAYEAMGQSNKQFKFGSGFIPGVYMVQVLQGSYKQSIKLVKK